MKTIWVTGSKGQLGTELSLKYKKLKECNFIFTDIDELDLTHKRAVESFFETNIPDIVINCAAYVAVDKAEVEKDKAFKLNRDVPKLLAENCEKFNSTLIHISTDYVFDGESCRPYNESDPTNPQSVYGQSKLEGEEFVLQGEKNLIVRTSWLYSAHGNNFVKTMIRLGKEKKEIAVVFDQVGTPTSAADFANALLSIVDSISSSGISKPGIYHFSNEGVCSWYDFAIEIMKLAGLSCKVKPITSDQYPALAKRPAFSVFNKTKIKESFNIEIPYWNDSFEKVILSLNTK